MATPPPANHALPLILTIRQRIYLPRVFALWHQVAMEATRVPVIGGTESLGRSVVTELLGRGA
ncbi:hypothetical protein GCM10010430_75260 [Kitasatospora cystarginea]|uniref:Uncharacterized protein n=1 Tax=Kitasatospora cystarginea TaxID=58350 RepID=A0ABN3F027_9ACTN